MVNYQEHTSGVAIVTGGSRGVGPYIARALSRAGYPVVIAARTAPLLEEQARSIADIGGVVATVEADVTIATDRDRIVAAARSLGPIAVLVNNAAVGPIRHFHDHDTAEVAAVVDVNLTAPLELSRLVITEMIATGGGRIVNVSTVAAKLPMPDMVLYSVTKTALAQLSAALDLEYRDRGIRSTTVFPGAIAEVGMAVRVVEESGVALPDDGAVKPDVVAKAVVAAVNGTKSEIFVGTGTKFMSGHPRLAYSLIRRSGVFAALSEVADRAGEASRASTAA